MATSPIVGVGEQFERILDVKAGGLHLREPNSPEQRRFVESRSLRVIVRAGRRGGKTVGAAIVAVRGFLDGRRVLYGTPTADQLDAFWREVTAALADPIQAGIYRKNETEHSVEMKGNDYQRIRGKTCWNADTLRGDNADLLILDEWQLMNESTWEDVGAPMLLDNNGRAVFIYTPPSTRSKSVTKARDKHHAAKMFKRYEADMKEALAARKEPRFEALHWTSHDNPALSDVALREITSDMSTLSYRQEIMAEDTDEVPGALWKRTWIDAGRVDPDQVPDLERVVVGVDPTGSTGTEAGIVCCGRGPAPRGFKDDQERHLYVLADSSMGGATSKAWAQAAVNLYFERRADRLHGERNYGGDMVESTIRQADGGQGVSYKDANATRGKTVRAEPVAACYERFWDKDTGTYRNGRGLAHHVGAFAELEDEMCSYVPGDKSPNRMDALVWAALPLVEGEGRLGLMEWAQAGGEQRELNRMNKTVTAKDLAKPVTNELTPRCPECSSVCVVKAQGGGMHCNSCGINWNPQGGNGKKPYLGQTRAEFLLEKGNGGRKW